ncbi:MAG: PAS domain S-box protein [Methanoregula sp.]|nr:PAS domain S-box protein [Methanoregula sp.]
MADKLRILYVDDEPGLLDIGKLFLERGETFAVDTLTSAVVALAQLKTVRYDAIIADYQMPEMDGISFLKQLKESGNKTPFIIFTGRGREEVVIEALNNGADFYIQKGGEPKSQFAELSHKIKIAVERKRGSDALMQDEDRLSALVTFYQMTSAPLKELMNFAVEKAVEITTSSIGYLAFVSDDETLLTMYAWSALAMKECNIDQKPIRYPIASTGLWGEAVRQRRPVITNDYAAESPLKKGYPEGHVPIIRHINIPVFDGPRIVMVAGVGNKSSDYDDRDLQELSLMMSGLWNVIKQRKAEEELEASVKDLNDASLRYKALIAASNTGAWENHRDSGFLWCSPEYFSMLGRDINDFDLSGARNIQQVWINLLHPEDRERASLIFESYMSNPQGMYEQNFRMLHKDGHWVWIWSRGKVVLDTGGKPTSITVGTHIDVTDRKRFEEELLKKNEELIASYEQITAAEEELRANLSELTRQEQILRENEERYRQFFKTTLDSVFITTADGQWVDCNDALVETFGYGNRKEIFDLPVTAFYAHPDQRAEFIKLVERDGFVKERPLQFKKKDGTVLFGLITIVPQKNKDGSLKGFIGTVHDITVKKRVYAPHSRREPFNRDRVENLPDYILVYGQDGKILYINPAAVKAMGYDENTVTGTSVLSYVAEEFRESVAAKMAERNEMGGIPIYEVELLVKGGLRKLVFVKGTQVLYDNNPATLLLLIDITRRKALEDELTARAAELAKISTAFQQANKKLMLLSSITRHDINNQLTVILGYLTLMENQQPDPVINDYYKKIISAANSISSMIRFTSEYEDIGISDPTWQDIRTILDTATKEAPLGKIVVKNDLPAGTEVFADPLIAKVCYNLMDNAARYGGKITTIRFSVDERDGNHVLVCEDDGDGVVAEEKDRIFDRGFGKNTGLGLALSREILSITGITIHETGEPGKGARFEILVPGKGFRSGKEEK